MITLTNSEDLDEMPLQVCAAFHQGLQKYIIICIISTVEPLKYIMDDSNLFVSICLAESFSIQSVHH